MNKLSIQVQSEGLNFLRLMMLLSGISPLFILWAIRGNNLIPDIYFTCFCSLMALLPNAFLWLRIGTAKRNNDRREVTVGTADDHRDHILVYLFVMLLPFYSEDLGTLRDLAATFAALLFIVFLFWRLNLHYINLVFAVLGYRVFTVYPPDDGNPITGKTKFTVITRRVMLNPSQTIIPYRLFDGVYLDLIDTINSSGARPDNQ